jgi:hypothetical protein
MKRTITLLALAPAAAGYALNDSGARTTESETARETTRTPARVQRFVSRPDLLTPVVDVVRSSAGTGGGYVFIAPSSGAGHRGAMIVDDAGTLVWFRKSRPQTTMDFKAGTYRGQPVISWWEGRHEKGVGRVGDYVIMDSSYKEVARLDAARRRLPDFHEVLLTSRNTILITAHEIVRADLSAVGGRKNGRVLVGIVQELAIPSGRVLLEWRSTDHVAIEESYTTDDIGNPFDYFHINSVDIDVNGHLIVSARNTSAIYKIHRRTGDVIWRLGGKRSDFTMGRATRFAFQHDARSHSRGRRLSLFDNGPVPNTKRESRGMVLALDLRRMRARLVREYRHSPSVFARVMGGAQLLGNGDMLVNWGSAGRFTQFTSRGTLRWEARLPRGGQNYRAFRTPWVGRPTEPPAAVVRGGMLFVSWNGATEVDRWQILAGDGPGSLVPGQVVPKGGFETTLQVPAGARYVAVAALDSSGRRLAQSRPLSV